MARAKRTARAEARRRYRAEHPQEAEELDDADDLAELDDAPAPRGRPARRSDPPAPAGRPRGGGLRAFREAYQPADIRGDLRALPELLKSRAVTLPLLLVAISAVILVLAVQTSPAGSIVPGASASPAASVVATPAASAAASADTSPGASVAASPGASGAATNGTSVAGSPLGIIASILALLFLGIPSPPAIGGIYLAAILAKRSSYLAGGLAGLFGSLGALGAVIAISPDQASASISVFGQILITSVIFGLLIGAGLGYYRRLLRLMNPAPNRPPNRQKPSARRR